MYQVKFLEAGTEDSDFDKYVIQGVQTTPFEPREGRTYRFRDSATHGRGVRFTVTAVMIDQVWGDTSGAVARVYLQRIN
jgi:hypothetical protein